MRPLASETVSREGLGLTGTASIGEGVGNETLLDLLVEGIEIRASTSGTGGSLG